MVKVGAIIQVRAGSERLPGKALLPLPFSGGPSIIEHVVNRAQQTKSIQQVIIATTDRPSDDVIAAFCQTKGLHCFRGAAEDVLDRFFQAANKYRLDMLVRLTGDNPFVMPGTIDYAVQKHSEAGVNYSITEGLPLGTNVEVISFSALQRAATEATEPADREHVTPYIRREDAFTTQVLPLISAIKSLRLTVDYPTDYALVSLLYGRLYKEGSTFGFAEVEQQLKENPWLAAINKENAQRKAFASEAEEMEEAKHMLRAGGFSRALQKLGSNS